MDEKKLVHLIDKQVWLMNTVRWALAQAQDSLIEFRDGASGADESEQEQDRGIVENGMTKEEEADSKVPATQEQITALLNERGWTDKWVSVRDAEFLVHALAEEKKAEKEEAARRCRPSYSDRAKGGE